MSKIQTSLAALVAVAVLAMPSVSQAIDGILDQQNLTANSPAEFGNERNPHYQSFVPDLPQVTDVVLAIELMQSNPTTVTASIFKAASNTGSTFADHAPTGASLASATITPTACAGGIGCGELTSVWTFATPAAVTPGLRYVIEFSYGPYGSNNDRWRPALNANSTDAYPNGMDFFLNTNTSEFTDNGMANRDLMFQVFGLPEPGTLSLLSLGGLMLMRRRRG